MPCPKCGGRLVKESGIVFCSKCFHVLNGDERTVYMDKEEKPVMTEEKVKSILHKKTRHWHG